MKQNIYERLENYKNIGTKEKISTKTEVILSAIRKCNNNISFDDLRDFTGLNIDEIFTAIGILVMEKRLLVRINHSVENVCIYKSSSDALYEKFMDLLFLHYGKKRQVAFYASNLCVTSKYLCSVIKKVSGKTPIEWINERTVNEIEYRLCHTQASIKEIAYELDFPNTSFFGKFFKVHKGMSPKHYRETFAENKFL